MKNIGIYRGIFDPVHEGHFSVLIDSINQLKLDKISTIVKFIGEKDPIASLHQRKEMLKLQIGDNKKIEIITQNIRGHIAHLLELGEKYNNENLVQICGSDKINREMMVYGNKGDNFGVIKRNDFSLTSESLEISQKKGIILEQIAPSFSTSSTYIRSQLLKNREKHLFD